ncbi:hypothetical protein ACJRO7_028990 [Eucalyptus globulus]|uniref:BTB domain-containing protein n=1 Tax=Eucalyptus globulus TaxID=34317 RepID=A0ABD3JWG2_EUCGL
MSSEVGYHLFLKRDDPEVSHYIKNDRHPALGSTALSELCWIFGLGIDINFLVGDKIFKVHREILATRSPLFGPIGNRDIEKLVVEDVDPYIFEAMLEFIYSNKFPDVSEIAGLISPFAYADVVLHLVAATDCYSLDRSRLLCNQSWASRSPPETTATIVVLADQHRFHKLKAIRLKFAANLANLGAVAKSEGFKHLERVTVLWYRQSFCRLSALSTNLPTVPQRNSSMVGQRPALKQQVKEKADKFCIIR